MIRTGFSFHTAYGHLKDVAARLSAIGWQRQPIADRCSTFGFNKWSKLVPNPVYGVELGLGIMVEKTMVYDFWTFLAVKDLQPLHDIIGIATDGRQNPYLTYEEAQAAPGLIKIAGNRALLDHMKPAKDLYMGLSPGTPMALYRAAKKAGYKFVAMTDNLYPCAEDKETYRLAMGWRGGTQTYPQHIMSDEELIEECYNFDEKDIKTAIKNRNAVLDSCTAKLIKATLYQPKKPKTLKQMCVAGAKRKQVDLRQPVYAARLARELQMIESKKFEDYFYIIADIVSWAKTRMIVGPARGSSCGSLVCYLLDITAVDPIQFNLIFERFIDINRSDLPDIDIDFSDAHRDEVFEYVSDKYGRERVARLGTVGMYRPKSILNLMGAALSVPKWKVAKVTESMIVRLSGDSRANQQYEDTLTETDAGKTLAKDHPQMILGKRLEAHPNASSQHAAGICITQDPIDRYVAVDRRSYSTMCDKKDAEDFNMLKIDMLGLTQLSIFERTLELIGVPPVSGWLEKLPLDDAGAFEVLNKRHYSGIFQFNGMALQSLSKQITFTGIEDIVAITALARPGPMAGGGANTWVRRKMGAEPVTYPHPVFEPYLSETLGITAYQEQVMQVGREIGDLSWEDVTDLRKAMSRSLGKEFFDRYGDRWKIGAMKKGISKEVADEVWDDLCGYGSWAFNRAHAVAYGLVSYYCAYLKAHHPLEFAAATLDAESLPMRQIMILRELRDEGIDYVPVDVEVSSDRWEIGQKDGKRYLVGPLSMIRGIGPVYLREILESRKNGTPIRPTLINKMKNVVTEIDSLYPVRDAIKKIYPDLKAVKIVSTPRNIKELQSGEIDGPVIVCAVVTKIAPRDENDPANVAKRNGKKYSGPTQALNLFIRDDTDEIFAKVDRWDYPQLGKKIAETGRAGKSLYAFKGTVPRDFRMLKITNVRYLGEIDGKTLPDATPLVEAAE